MKCACVSLWCACTSANTRIVCDMCERLRDESQMEQRTNVCEQDLPKEYVCGIGYACICKAPSSHVVVPCNHSLHMNASVEGNLPPRTLARLEESGSSSVAQPATRNRVQQVGDPFTSGVVFRNVLLSNFARVSRWSSCAWYCSQQQSCIKCACVGEVCVQMKVALV